MIDNYTLDKMRDCATFFGEPACTEFRKLIDEYKLLVAENAQLKEKLIACEFNYERQENDNASAQ